MLEIAVVQLITVFTVFTLYQNNNSKLRIQLTVRRHIKDCALPEQLVKSRNKIIFHYIQCISTRSQLI